MSPLPPHGGQLRHIAEHFGIPQGTLLDFSANINPAGPPPGVLPALHAALADPATLNLYPDLDQPELKQALARYAGVEPTQISIANGFVPLLEAALRTLRIRRCLLPVPAFIEYRRTLELAGVEVLPVPLSAAHGFPYQPAALFAQPADAILLANPQNPTGTLHTQAQVTELVEEAMRRGQTVLLDEAFIDFAPTESLTPLTHRHPNLVIFRSVTKFFAIPGLRIAYAASHPDLSRRLDATLAPWPVTTLAAHGLLAALRDTHYRRRTHALLPQSRAELHAGLSALGLHAYPSGANFLLFQLPLEIHPQTFWRDLIVRHGIVLRDCANYENLSPGHFRAAIRTARETERLLKGIKLTTNVA